MCVCGVIVSVQYLEEYNMTETVAVIILSDWNGFGGLIMGNAIFPVNRLVNPFTGSSEHLQNTHLAHVRITSVLTLVEIASFQLHGSRGHAASQGFI